MLDDIKSLSWTKSDDYQWVASEEGIYHFIEVRDYGDDEVVFVKGIVFSEDCGVEDNAELLRSYYGSTTEFLESHSETCGSIIEQLIAEMIFESTETAELSIIAQYKSIEDADEAIVTYLQGIQ